MNFALFFPAKFSKEALLEITDTGGGLLATKSSERSFDY